MRPISLTMEAFGSYGQKTTIDFTEANQNLFLITGDTGAGKSTIFDAIAFALYGQASSGSNKKDGSELQSQFVGYDKKPFVELTFSEVVGGEALTYTVKRVPRHVRTLKKGSGTTDEKEAVSLILPGGREFSSNKKETDSKLEEIVGLTKEQFMQIAMIAQGEFMELLRADSNKKKEIFRRLFGTERFQKIVEELASRKKEKLAELNEKNAVLKAKVGSVEIPGEHEELAAQQKSICNSEKPNIAELEHFLEKLGAFLSDLSSQEKDAMEQKERISALRDEKLKEHSKAQALLNSYMQLEQAQGELAVCEAAAGEMERLEQLGEAISAAYEIKKEYQYYRTADKTAADTEQKMQARKVALPDLKVASEKAAAAEAVAKAEQEAELEQFTRISQRVSKAKELFAELSMTEKDLEMKQKLLQDSTATAEKAAATLVAFERQENQWRSRADELKDAEVQLTLWQQKQQEAAAIAVDIADVKTLRQEISKQQQFLSLSEQNYEQARSLHQVKEQDYLRKQSDFLDAQAGFLAREKLKLGQPCPVCGSLEHPRPCPLSEEHRELTREVLDALSAEVSKLYEKRSAASEAASSARTALLEKQNSLSASLQKLRERMEKALPELPTELTLSLAEQLIRNWQSALDQEGSRLRENAETLKKIQRNLFGAAEEKQRLSHEKETTAQREAAAKMALAAAEATLSSLVNQKDFASVEEADSVLKAAAFAKENKDSAYSKARMAAQTAKEELDQSETLLRNYSQELPKQQEERNSRKAAYEQILAQKQMEEEQWQTIASTHENSEVPLIQEKLSTYRRRRDTAKGAFAAAKEAIGQQPKPDLEALTAEKNAAESRQQEAESRLKRLQTLLEQNSRLHKDLTPKLKERGLLTQEYSRIDSLHSRLAGKVSGAKMDIETFVQRYYLQRILYAANARFEAMSAGQFQLRMTEEDRAGEGKNRGLDLMVYSNVTGKEREVRTLSGGESFMAALSLALGMADQIQENSASINLDIMFIDEGFGSLDDHSRNQAVRVLKEMAGGSKLIGIISHVTELKQEIENQLVVRKGDDGSHVKWQIS